MSSSFASRSTIPLLRASGAVASALLCIHSTSYLFAPSHSLFRFVHNFADLILFLAFGVSGLVAEVFPRDSLMHKILKSNFPFLNGLIGRGVVYVLFGMIVMGNYSTSDDPTESLQHVQDAPYFWSYFCVSSGLYMSGVGVVLLVNALRGGSTRSLVSQEIPISFVPSIVTTETLLVREQLVPPERTLSPFPTAV